MKVWWKSVPGGWAGVEEATFTEFCSCSWQNVSRWASGPKSISATGCRNCGNRVWKESCEGNASRKTDWKKKRNVIRCCTASVRPLVPVDIPVCSWSAGNSAERATPAAGDVITRRLDEQVLRRRWSVERNGRTDGHSGCVECPSLLLGECMSELTGFWRPRVRPAPPTTLRSGQYRPGLAALTSTSWVG